MPSKPLTKRMLRPEHVLITCYVLFCVGTLWVNFWAGAVFVGLGVVAVLCVIYLIHHNLQLLNSQSDPVDRYESR